MPRLFSLAAVCIALAVCAAARADTVVLATGGRIEGDVQRQGDGERYLVALPSGAKVTFTKAQVTRVIAANSAEANYEQYLQKMPDDAEGHWKMANWCVQNNLPALREFHLREVVRHEPGHEKARLALGYTNIDGRWVLPAEHNQRLGYVKHDGAWRTPQDVALANARAKSEEVERKWRADIKLWRGWLNRPSKQAEGLAKMQAIADPVASPALKELLDDEKEPANLRVLYTELLGQMVTTSPLARGTLVDRALYDKDEQVRERALSALEQGDTRAIGAMFAKALGDKKNEVVNRAALGVARMKYEPGIPSLIDHLETKHTVITGQGQGNIGAGFNPGGGLGSFSAGGGPKATNTKFKNDGVRQALVTLTGSKDFGFDTDAWRNWYAETRSPKDIDLRRRP
jgi:hypothetical protein